MSKCKVLIYKGLSFSGKSLDAIKRAKELGDAVIITKDDIRIAMSADYAKGIKVKESKVIDKRNELIMKALEQGKNILIPDTNLSSRVNHIANIKALVYPKYREQYDFEVVDFTDTPLETLLERASKTTRPEGASFWIKVVKEQADQFYEVPLIEQDESLEKIVISDCDGTINLVSPHRSPYNGADCHLDTQNEVICEYLHLMKAKGYKIILMSGLEDTYRKERENWLAANCIPYDELYMRRGGDKRGDDIIKNELYEEHIKNKYFVHVICEDRPKMLRYWLSKGFKNRLLAIGNYYKDF